MNEFEFQIASKIQFRPAYFIQSDVFRRNINRKKDEIFKIFFAIFESCVTTAEFLFGRYILFLEININVCCDFCFTIFEPCVNNVEIPYM